jgi:hypothetical protein
VLAGKEQLIAGVYVDDLIITEAHGENIDDFKHKLADLFSHERSCLALLCRHRGEAGEGLHHPMPARIRRETAKAKQHGELQVVRNADEERLKLVKASIAAKMDGMLCRSIVCGLCYLTHVTNISFVIGYVSRFVEDLQEDYWFWLSAYCATSRG